MAAVSISVVVPVFNGSQSLDALFNRTRAVMDQNGHSFEMVFVDDCSPDDSWQQILALKEKHPTKVRAIKLAKNTGQHNATLCGMHHSEGDLIVTIDDDLQIPPEEITKLVEKHRESGCDLVYGVFKDKKHSLVRNAGSWMVNKFFRIFAHTSGDGSSFRLMTRQLAGNLKHLNQKYLLLDEVLGWYTNSICSVTVTHHARTLGASNYSTLRLVFITINYIINYTAIPLRLMTYVGLLGSMVTFIISLYYIHAKLFKAVELGFTSLIVSIFFSTSVMLFCLGIIGEYISRLFTKDGSPHYIIKEIK